ncbi:hypothetical protein [Coleofasciculus chthonoplastes]
MQASRPDKVRSRIFYNSGKMDSYTRRLSPFPNDSIPSRPIR